jgi:hypothetical protein
LAEFLGHCLPSTAGTNWLIYHPDLLALYATLGNENTMTSIEGGKAPFAWPAEGALIGQDPPQRLRLDLYFLAPIGKPYLAR